MDIDPDWLRCLVDLLSICHLKVLGNWTGLSISYYVKCEGMYCNRCGDMLIDMLSGIAVFQFFP